MASTGPHSTIIPEVGTTEIVATMTAARDSIEDRAVYIALQPAKTATGEASVAVTALAGERVLAFKAVIAPATPRTIWSYLTFWRRERNANEVYFWLVRRLELAGFTVHEHDAPTP